jgi:hypothetical protein
MKVILCLLMVCFVYAGDKSKPIKEKPNWKTHLSITYDMKSPVIGKDYIQVKVKNEALYSTYFYAEFECKFKNAKGEVVQTEKHLINEYFNPQSEVIGKIYHNYRANAGYVEVKLINAKYYNLKLKEKPKPKGKKIVPEFAPEFQ